MPTWRFLNIWNIKPEMTSIELIHSGYEKRILVSEIRASRHPRADRRQPSRTDETLFNDLRTILFLV